MEHSKKYRLMANKLIRTLPEFADIKAAKVKIAYLSSLEEKKRNKRTIFADCNLVSDRYSWCCPYDFFIVVYEPNVVGFSEKQLETLLRQWEQQQVTFLTVMQSQVFLVSSSS